MSPPVFLRGAGRRAMNAPGAEKMAPDPPCPASRSANVALNSTSRSMGVPFHFGRGEAQTNPVSPVMPPLAALLSVRHAGQTNHAGTLRRPTQVSAWANRLLSGIGGIRRTLVSRERLPQNPPAPAGRIHVPGGRVAALTGGEGVAIVVTLHPERGAVGQAKVMRESSLEILL